MQTPRLIIPIRKTQGPQGDPGVIQSSRPSGTFWTNSLSCLSTGMLWALGCHSAHPLLDMQHAASYCLIMLSSSYGLQQIRTNLSKSRDLLCQWNVPKLTAETTGRLHRNHSSCLVGKALLTLNKTNPKILKLKDEVFSNVPLDLRSWVDFFLRRKNIN